MTNWRESLAEYTDRRVMLILPLGFASGLPLVLTASTLSAWLATVGVSRTAIGLFALVGLPYALKFVWSPLIDRLPPPIPIGRRRGWGLTIQLALFAAILALGSCNPKTSLIHMSALALLVAFLSASQDIVIDAYRVEILDPDQQGPGAGMIQTGYRIGMLASGAVALVIAEQVGWFAAYATMAALVGTGMLVFIFGPEPGVPAPSAGRAGGSRIVELRDWLETAVIGPFTDFMKRRAWVVIVIFVVGYKLGEALAGVMANPLYISLGFSLDEIAALSKLVGFAAIIVGALVGGALTAKLGAMRALLICGLLQSAGNLFYVLQAVEGHRLVYLALCVISENLTGAMATAALIAYLSGLCSPAFTATQYALLSSLASVGRTIFASVGGFLANRLGWVAYFSLSAVITLPALAILVWLMRHAPVQQHGSAAAAVASKG